MSMLDDFDDFLAMQQRFEQLKERRETLRAVTRMAALMKTACDYICENTKEGYFREKCNFACTLRTQDLTLHA